MRIAIDLTWVKPRQSGGIESYIRNLLDGFQKYSNDEFILILGKNNIQSFEKYNFSKICLPVDAESIKKRIVYQNIIFSHELNKTKADLFFCPVYAMPLFYRSNIKCVATVHDLQAVNYPEYFSKSRVKWLDLNWKTLEKRTNKIIAISDFVKQDIIDRYNVKENHIVVLPNPIVLNDNYYDFRILERKYHIQENSYYYTILSMLPHKNLITLVKMIRKIVSENVNNIPNKLIVSGVNGISRKNIERVIDEYALHKNIILTGFVDNDERNSLIKHCHSFLFPSLFEGFGMPPIEAMELGAHVITTKRGSLFEVTKGLCNYVEDPFNIDEWIERIKEIDPNEKHIIKFKEYSLEMVTKEYLKLFHSI